MARKGILGAAVAIFRAIDRAHRQSERAKKQREKELALLERERQRQINRVEKEIVRQQRQLEKEAKEKEKVNEQAFLKGKIEWEKRRKLIVKEEEKKRKDYSKYFDSLEKETYAIRCERRKAVRHALLDKNLN